MWSGEIFFPQNTEAGFVAAVQPTTVRLYDDAARALKPNADLPRMLALNTTTLANDIHLVNPVELNNGTFVAWDVYVDAGHAYLDGGVNYTVDGVPSTAQGSLAKKGAGTLHMPALSRSLALLCALVKDRHMIRYCVIVKTPFPGKTAMNK